MKNQHSTCIPEEKIVDVKTILTSAKDVLFPYMSTLSNEDRRGLPKMGEKSLSFVTKSYELCQQHPELMPGYLNVEDFKIDVADATGLLPIKDLLTQLLDMVNDTAMLAGSEAYSQALLFYNNAKQASKNNVPGAKAVFNELKLRFPASRRKSEDEQE